MRIMEHRERNNGELRSNSGSDESDDEEEGRLRKLAKKRLKRK